jgi:thioesterase domain-containing protein
MNTPIARSELGLATAYAAPAAGTMEERIALAFAKCLRVDAVSRDDCFFDLGGDSMAAAQLALLVAGDIGVQFPVSLLASASTPERLAASLRDMLPAAATAPVRAKPPIFSVHGMHGFMLPRKDFLAGLHPGQEFHMFELPGLRDGSPPLTSVEQIAQRYCEQLGARYPQGPLRLTGFCMGSLIALEMSVQLARSGRPVQKLVLVEPNMSSTLDELWIRDLWHDPEAARQYASEARRRETEAMFRERLLRQQHAGKDRFLARYAGYEFSVDARAALMAAFAIYKPATVSSTVHVVVSSDRESRLDPLNGSGPSVWDAFIPDRRLYVAGQSHIDVLHSANGTTSRMMQRIFDAEEPL